MCVCVCVCERERERERVNLSVCVSVSESVSMCVCVCVRVNVCVRACVSMCMRARSPVTSLSACEAGDENSTLKNKEHHHTQQATAEVCKVLYALFLIIKTRVVNDTQPKAILERQKARARPVTRETTTFQLISLQRAGVTSPVQPEVFAHTYPFNQATLLLLL